MKFLRGTPFDPFGYAAERRHERAAIRQYEADMREVLANVTDATMPVALELAELPLTVRGYGPVKAQAETAAARRRIELLAQFRSGNPPLQQAAE
jgi:indolepyruvate ferredoxin oxidoreductase